jgi:PleD family two-component response regulator
MQTQDYPLVFIVEENAYYNRLIVNHLTSKKVNRIESFLSEEECLKNMFKRPDVVIQDYLMNEMSGNVITNESKKSNTNTEFVYLSDLDNFSKKDNQNIKLVGLSESDKFDTSADTVKYGSHGYVVKDLNALEKLIIKIGRKQQIQHIKAHLKTSFSLFIVALTSMFISRSIWQ